MATLHRGPRDRASEIGGAALEGLIDGIRCMPAQHFLTGLQPGRGPSDRG